MKSKITFLFLALFIGALTLIISRCQPNNEKQEESVIKNNAYVGDKTCQTCHSKEYNEWLTSDHFRAMELPNDSTVLGNFNNAKYVADGVTSYFFKKDDKFFINTQGDDGKNHDYEIKYTFGYFPLQQYLVEFPGGRLQATRASWDSRDKKWFNQNKGQVISPHDWLNWTQNAQNWNTMCAACHSTDLQKNYDIKTDTYHTTFSSINVSCESCHGAGKAHIDYVNSTDFKKGKKQPNSDLWLGKNVSQNVLINSCAPCHSLKGEISDKKLPSEELLDNYIPVVPTTEHFFADGQIRDEDYNYAAFLQSKFYMKGGTCSSCHNVHTGKTLQIGNQLCNSCHGKELDSPSHTHHAVNTVGAQCISCHMPTRTYMENDTRHDHSFRVPRPDLTAQYGVPNTCNTCHSDKSPQWAAAAIDKWFGTKRAYHWSVDLIPGSLLNNESEPHLAKLVNNNDVPKIIQATAVNYLGQLGSSAGLNTLIRGLSNEDAQVRYEALRSLASYRPDQYINPAASLLKDKVRAVRIAAADLYTGLPNESIPSEYLDAYTKAKSELVSYLLYQADFAHGNIMIGDYYMRAHDPANAELFYKRALKKDSLANLTRINLSILYNTQGRNNEALNVLQDAVKVDHKNGELYYDMALIQNEVGNKKAALENFDKAYRLHLANTRLYYNYGLLLQQNGNIKKSVEVLQSGLKLIPNSIDILYALTFVYHQSGQKDQALKYGRELKKLAPVNNEFQGLYQALGI